MKNNTQAVSTTPPASPAIASTAAQTVRGRRGKSANGVGLAKPAVQRRAAKMASGPSAGPVTSGPIFELKEGLALARKVGENHAASAAKIVRFCDNFPKDVSPSPAVLYCLRGYIEAIEGVPSNLELAG